VRGVGVVRGGVLMYTVIGYRDGSARHVIESDSLANLVGYARGWTRACVTLTGRDWCESAIIFRGQMREYPEFGDIVAIVTMGDVFRPDDGRGMWRKGRTAR
jgi:hypothetical protein